MEWFKVDDPQNPPPFGEGVKCGESVLVVGGEFWDEGETYATKYPLDRAVTAYYDPMSGWVIGRSETYGDSVMAEPTHWMPLPPAPTGGPRDE